jgi:hypothetical protein
MHRLVTAGGCLCRPSLDQGEINVNRLSALSVCLVLVGTFATQAQPAPTSVETDKGLVKMIDKERLVFQQRLPDGKFGKVYELKLTKTSSLTTISLRKMGDSTIVAQIQTDPREVSPGQAIAITYSTIPGEGGKPDTLVLLSGVLQPVKK